MKKVLSIGILAISALWLSPGTSSAGGTFGYFTATSCWPFNCCASCGCCDGCCNKCCTTICIKPYNAFSSPCIPGTNLFCGCSVNLAGQGCEAGYGATSGCCDGAVLGQLPNLMPTPGATATVTTPPHIYMPPGAQPMPAGVSRQMWQQPTPNYGPMQIGYYPAYAPTYNPAVNYVQPMTVPYYWNSNGR